jgi:mannose-6-phosphate isomerase-like protein (cupin superfamily)
MKLFTVRDFFQESYKEYIIGSKETGKHTVYLVFGEVKKGEARPMVPNGHDEILFLISGDATLEAADRKVPLAKEQAVAMDPDERFTLSALTDCQYVVAGAHPTAEQHG